MALRRSTASAMDLQIFQASLNLWELPTLNYNNLQYYISQDKQYGVSQSSIFLLGIVIFLGDCLKVQMALVGTAPVEVQGRNAKGKKEKITHAKLGVL